MPVTFLMAGLTAGVLAMSIPVIIHLLHRQRTMPIQWGAMQFLLESRLQMKRRKKVDHWILMALRMLVLGLLALLLARPLWVKGKYMAAIGKGRAPIDVAVVLDHSLSTGRQAQGGKTVFDQGKAVVDEVTRQLRDNDTVSVVMAEHRPRPLEPALLRSGRSDELRRALAGQKPGITDCNIPEAVGAARQLIAKGHNLNKLIVVVSDQQRANWHVNEDALWRSAAGERVQGMERTVSVVSYPINPDVKTANVSVGELSIQPSLIGVNRPVQITASVSNSGPGALGPLTAHLVVNGKPTDQAVQVPQLAANQSATIRFDYRFPDAGSNWVKVTVDANDALAADDESVAAANVWQKLPVLVIDVQLTTVGSYRGSAFLKAAMQPEEAHEAPLVQPTIVSVSEAPAQKLEDYAVTIVNDCPTLPSSMMTRLMDYARSGRGVWFVLGPRTQRSLGQELTNAGLFNADFVEQRIAPTPPPGAEVRDATNPMVALITANDRNSFAGAATRQWWSLKPRDADTQVVLGVPGGEPLVLERPIPPNGGHVALWATSADGSWNNWNLMPNFVPLVNETLYHLCSGQTRGLENRGIEAGKVIEWSGPAKPAVQAAQITRPDDKTVQLPPPRLYNGRYVLDYADTFLPGIYQMRFNPTEIQPVYYAVGISRAELDNSVLKDEDRDWLKRGGFVSDTIDASTLAAAVTKENPGAELWKWLGVAVLAMLVAETYMTYRMIGRQSHVDVAHAGLPTSAATV